MTKQTIEAEYQIFFEKCPIEKIEDILKKFGEKISIKSKELLLILKSNLKEIKEKAIEKTMAMYKYIKGLLEFSKMENFDNLIIYIIRYEEMPEIAIPKI